MSSMADSEKQGPVRQSLCASLRKDGHWKCLCLTSLIVGCLAAISWCHLTISHKKVLTYLDVSLTSTERPGPCKEGYVYIPVAFVIMLYLVYLVECWHSHTRLELRYKCDITTVYNTIYKMQSALPVIWWKATCYHYVRRTRHVMRYRNGDAFTSTQVYYERVDSKTAGAAFNYTQCGVKDISRPLSELEKFPAIKIKVSKGFSFANLDTEFEFEEQRAQFFQEYETKDDYMEGREGMDLINVDFKEYMIAFRDPNNLPWYVSHVVFWIASLVLLSWPLRAVIEYKTAHLHYHIHKLFGSNYLEGENYPNMMSRVNTMNSEDLEMSIRNNNVIVPSYSEAMLADIQLRRDYGAIKTPPCKFPRSLTNVTLAGRCAVARRSLTPAVTMNRVKKFKSCSAFGKSDSIDSSLNDGTIRHQIQQLLRDRNRLQRKATGQSSFSVSGISIGNGNVRFNVGTPVTPDDSAISNSFSCHSVTSSRTNETLSECAVIATTSESSTSARPQRTKILAPSSFQLAARPKKLSKHPTHSPIAINRSKSVPEAVEGELGFVHTFRPLPISQPGTSTSGEVGPSFVPTRPISIPRAVGFFPTVIPLSSSNTTPPVTPPSPPCYDEAIQMRRIASSRGTGLISSVPSTPVNTLSEIGLTGDSPSPRTRGEIPVTGPRAFRAGKQNSDSISSVLPVDLPINRSLSQEPFTGVLGNYQPFGIDTRMFEPTAAESSNIRHVHHPAQQQGQGPQRPTRGLPPTLKPLPKVNAPSIHSESDESDVEYLPGENLGCTDEPSPSRVRQPPIVSGLGSIPQGFASHPQSHLVDARGASLAQPGRTRERDTPSTSVAAQAEAILAQGPRPNPAGSKVRHKETPV